MSPQRAEYYRGLNVWRAGMMLFGVLVHGLSMPIPDSWHGPVNAIQLSSHLFRMEAFFAISGFLAWRGFSKDGASFSRARLIQLSLPLLTTYFLILPAALPFIRMRFGYAVPGDLMHLWFLVTLIAIVIIVDEVERRSQLITTIAKFALINPFTFVFLVFGVAIASLVFSSAAIKTITSDPYVIEAHSFAFAIFRVPYFLSYYILGFVLAQGDFLKINSKIIRIAGLIGVVLMFTAIMINYRYGNVFSGIGRPFFTKIFALVFSPFVSLPMSLLVLQTGTSIDMGGKLTDHIGKSSFTVYLCHYTMLYISYGFLSILGMGQGITVILTIIFGFVASFAFHFLVVQNSSYLRLVLNGSFAIKNRQSPV